VREPETYERFLAVRFSVCRMRFLADLVLANVILRHLFRRFFHILPGQ
jgi:hypothetical protein